MSEEKMLAQLLVKYLELQGAERVSYGLLAVGRMQIRQSVSWHQDGELHCLQGGSIEALAKGVLDHYSPIDVNESCLQGGWDENKK